MRRYVLVVLVCWVLGGVVGWAGEAGRVPQWYLDSIADNPKPLPRGLAPGEVFVPVYRDADAPDAPPEGPVWTPAEYDHNDGLLISWIDHVGYVPLLTDIAFYVSTLTSGTVWVVVANAGQQASVTSLLAGVGANMAQVEFIIYSTDSIWIRDYGPRFIREGDHRAMVDHTYNRSRPNDNAFPDHLATLWGEPQYDIPLTHGGGNFHLFSDGSREAFMTELIANENPGLTELDIIEKYQQYQGLDLTITDALERSYDWTQHIDMWILPVADREVIIGQYPPGDTHTVGVTEGTAATLESRGYTVHRTPGWSTGYYGTHYTYTNSVVFNEIVLTCQFQHAENDAAAVAIFETAFPDKQIVPVDCSDIIGDSGAVHCIVMHVPRVEVALFADGFESGYTSAWDETVDD